MIRNVCVIFLFKYEKTFKLFIRSSIYICGFYIGLFVVDASRVFYSRVHVLVGCVKFRVGLLNMDNYQTERDGINTCKTY